MKTIVLTGGGTGGHIMPHLAILSELKKHFDKIYYIGTNGMEKEIIKNAKIDFYEISAVKFERKLTLKNLLIPIKLSKSVKEAKKILKELKPNVVFSKGGYVSMPVCIAASKLNIPVVSHESDLSMGLANKIISKYANVVLTSFKETATKNKKFKFAGSPIRPEIFLGNKNNITKNFYYSPNKKTILFVGGSLGAKAINDFVYSNLEKLTKKYNVLHIYGKSGKKIEHKNYYGAQRTNNIEDFFDLCDICISRSGANTIFELAAILKPMLLIPLPKGNSRGDQIENAKNFCDKGLCEILYQDNLNFNNINKKIDYMLTNKEKYIKNMQKLNLKDANKNIVETIISVQK